MNRTHSAGWAAIVVLSALFGSAHGGNAASTAAFVIVAGQGGANGGNNFNGVDKGRLNPPPLSLAALQRIREQPRSPPAID